jgi:hypothetical protein
MVVVGAGMFAAARVSVTPTSSPGATPVPVGDTAQGGQGQDVDGIKCETHEQVVYHVHAHLSILDNGVPEPVWSQIGIPGLPSAPTCYYWLHTHDQSGIIHIESPNQRIYTLGQFFDIWGVTFSRSSVANIAVPNGELTVFVDGEQFTDDPRGIQLSAHTQVVIEVGKVVQPPQFSFPEGL